MNTDKGVLKTLEGLFNISLVKHRLIRRLKMVLKNVEKKEKEC